VLPLQSTTFTDQEFLVGGTHGKPAMVAGVLSLPRAGTEKFPVVILLHGSGGISSYVTNWEQDFLAMGVATFVDDSFSGRGIVATNTDQSQLAGWRKLRTPTARWTFCRITPESTPRR
jgi:dienelactone hydrolase